MKNCRHCKVEFTPNHRLGPKRAATVQHCSTACAAAARRKIEPKCCPTCMATFTPDNTKRKFCSLGCASVAHKGKASIAGKPARYKKTNGVLEHRAVMAKIIGRPLVRGETVHHRNGLKQDNAPDNLELWFTPQPGGQRIPDLIAYVVKHHTAAVETALHTQLSFLLGEQAS